MPATTTTAILKKPHHHEIRARHPRRRNMAAKVTGNAW